MDEEVSQCFFSKRVLGRNPKASHSSQMSSCTHGTHSGGTTWMDHKSRGTAQSESHRPTKQWEDSKATPTIFSSCTRLACIGPTACSTLWSRPAPAA